MKRWATVAAAAGALLLGATTVQAQQPSPAERAEQLNEEGKQLFRDKSYDAAADKFRQAIVFSPEGRFYFNLCFTLEQMGRFREALTACQAVEPNGASIPLQDKTNQLIDSLRQRLAAQQGGGGGGQDGPPPDGGDGGGDPGVDPDPGGGGYAGPAGGGNVGAYGGQPTPGISAEAEAPYTWSLGGELGVLANNYGDASLYAEGGVQLKLFLNFLVAQSQNIGLQGYLNISQIGAESAGASPLEIIDLGGAAYKHFELADNLLLTPLAGVHLAFVRPDAWDDSATAASLGMRLEASLGYVFGEHHQISLTPSLNFYTRAGGGNYDPVMYGLGKGGSTFSFAAGYTYRFSMPFGHGPIFVLE